jgi:hypothetical protein
MPFSRDPSTLGDKVLPKVIAAVSQSVIATKKGLMPTEHKLRVSAMQSIIDTAGMEVAEHIAPMLDAAIDANPDMHPSVKDYLTRTASGKNQLQAIAGHLALSTAGSALSTAINNEIAPFLYSIVGVNPHLRLDPQTAAAAAATTLFSEQDAFNEGASQGLNSIRMTVLRQLAQAIPDSQTLGQLVNRGYLSARDANYWIGRGGYGPTLHAPLLQLRQQIISVADAALAVLKGAIQLSEGQQIAAANGMTAEDFGVILLNTGEPPGLQQLDEAYRRNIIDRNRLVRGIKQSRVRDEWIDVIEALRYSPMSSADAAEASLKGYLPEAEAARWSQESGLDPKAFPVLLKAIGDPLSRTEMADLVNRGEASIEEFKAAIRQSRVKDSYVDHAAKLIERPMTIGDAVRGFVQGYLTENEADHIQGMNGLRAADRKVVREIDGIPLSLTELLRLHRMGKLTIEQVKQGLRESRLKDKYVNVALDLTVTLPSIFELRLLMRDGAITDAEAAKILTEHGFQPEIVKGIIHAFGSGSTGASKSITEGMAADLYLEGAIDRAELLKTLEAIGYSKAQSELIVQVADWRIELQSRSALISRVRAQYVERHITEAEAEGELYRNSVPHAVIARVMAEWNAEIRLTVKLLTPAQVADAWNDGLFAPNDEPANNATAIKYLERLAYSHDDAKMILQIKAKAIVPGL